MSASCQIRDMTKMDIDRVGEVLYGGFTAVAEKYGYSPIMHGVQEGKSWAWTMYHYASSLAMVAVVADSVVGVNFLNRRGDAGGAGPCTVDPAFQGTSIGAKLTDAMLARAAGLSSLRVVQEAYNAASFSLLYKYDFTPVADLIDLYLEVETKERVAPDSDITELTAEDLEAICAYDTPRSKFDRSRDLAYYARWGKVLVYRSRSGIQGYLACLPGSRSVQLGPLLAEGEEEAERLFRQALVLFEGKTCRTRVMAGNSLLVRNLMKLGFRVYCTAFLMVRGVWRPGPYVEAYGRFPEGV